MLSFIPFRRKHASLLAFVACLFLLGCEQSNPLHHDVNQPGKTIVKSKKVLTAADLPQQEPAEPKPTPGDLPAAEPATSTETTAPSSTPPSRPPSRGTTESAEVRRIGAEIQQSLELGPTLVIWLFDSTASAQGLVDSCRDQAKQLYSSTPFQEVLIGGEQKLLTAIASFDDQLQYSLETPSDQSEAITQALSLLPATKVTAEKPYGAIKAVLEKFAPQAQQQGRSVLIVVVTDEAGEDLDQIDATANLLKRQAIPLFVIGPPAPWGQLNPFAANMPRPTGSNASDSDSPHYGPESLASERVHVAMPSGIGGFRIAKNDLIDSGFGPFGLERLCRAGGGSYLAVRPRTLGGFGRTQTWPTGTELKTDPSVVSKYAPEYISRTEYERLAKENKARYALLDAAKQGFADCLVNPDLRFAKSANEAEMKTRLDDAQKQPARIAGPLDKLYQTLQPGEVDREKLTSPRWQAEFDYAYGRVLAAKVRNDGYNQMIAALKNGKGPKDSSKNEYVLVPADSYETNSALKKMAEKATFFLKRVVQEHPGTHWAKLAEDDLQIPLGWRFE